MKKLQFQSTHPVRGATARRAEHPLHRVYFNPRTPCGVRLEASQKLAAEKLFQSTHPVRGATAVAEREVVEHRISIHAPRAGCDAVGANGRARRNAISIHAPRAGCDWLWYESQSQSIEIFQSTHPVRGATANMYNLVCSYFCNFTKSDVCLLTLYLFYHAISTENVVFSRFSAVRSAPGIHVRSRFAPRQSISSPSGA